MTNKNRIDGDAQLHTEAICGHQRLHQLVYFFGQIIGDGDYFGGVGSHKESDSRVALEILHSVQQAVVGPWFPGQKQLRTTLTC